LAGDLVDNLMEQIKQFEPGLPWENVPKPSKTRRWYVYRNFKQRKNSMLLSLLCWGLGSFEPRKPLIEDIEFYEDKGIKYFIKNPENSEMQPPHPAPDHTRLTTMT
jgi:thioredoxin reductase (NADPH)